MVHIARLVSVRTHRASRPKLHNSLVVRRGSRCSTNGRRARRVRAAGCEAAMTNRAMSNLTIENNQAAQHWEAHVDQQLAVAEYGRRGNTIFFIHTDVPHELEGQGVASKLMKTALDEARALVEETGERFWEAEIYRLKGE